MNSYESRKVKRIVICYDPNRIVYKWYAQVDLEAAERSSESRLEIRLRSPVLTKALPPIIKALESRKISTTYLPVELDEDKKAA